MVWAATGMNAATGIYEGVDAQQKEKEANNTNVLQGGSGTKSNKARDANTQKAGQTAVSIGMKFLE